MKRDISEFFSTLSERLQLCICFSLWLILLLVCLSFVLSLGLLQVTIVGFNCISSMFECLKPDGILQILHDANGKRSVKCSSRKNKGA